MNSKLFLVLLLLCTVFPLHAAETRLLIGGELVIIEFGAESLPLAQLELTISTSPLWKGFQQEIGLRYVGLLVLGWADLVIRSWWSFPRASSPFIRERFRLGVEYSPMLLDYALHFAYGIEWLNGFTAAVCSTVSMEARPAIELFLAGGVIILGYEPEIYLAGGVNFRRRW